MAHDPHDPMQVVGISPNFAQDQTLLAATGRLSIKVGAIVVFKSTDGGITWSPVSGIPGNSDINSMAFSPAYVQDHTAFVGGGAGLATSIDGANTWSSVTPTPLLNFALSPNFGRDNTLFLITSENKILKSTNRGARFTAVSVPLTTTAALSFIAISPNFATDHSLLLGSQVNGIFKSVDGGLSWVPVTSGRTLPAITALCYSPAYSTDKTVFATTHGGGFLISTNRGNSWKKSNSGLTDNHVISMAFSPTFAQDSTLWITTATNGVFQSTNSGASWGRPVTVSRQLSNLTSVHYQTIAAGPGLQVLGTYEGLWTSTNNGASWQYIDTVPTRSTRYIHLSPGYAADQTVFVTTYGSGNLWSTDGGNTWSLQNTGMSAPYVDGSAISPNFVVDGIAFSGTHVGLSRTNNGGATWTLTPGPGVAAYPRGFAVSPNFANDSTVYIGTTPATGHVVAFREAPNSLTPGLYVSTDGGSTWKLSSLQGQGVVSVAFSPAFATDQTAFAATESGGLYETTNAAATWTQVNMGSASPELVQVILSPDFPSDHVIFVAGQNGGIYKSSDGGANWLVLPNTGTIRSLDLALSPNYAADQTMFIGTQNAGVMVSTNGGITLTPVASFTDVFVTAVAISPDFANDQTLFAAGYHGLYKSADGGATWSYLASPARIEESRCLASSLQEPPTVMYPTGGWSAIAAPLASTSRYALTSTAPSVVLNFTGTGVRWISWTGPAQGSASIQLDGITLGNVSLNAATDSYQQVVWEQHGLACTNHTFTIVASPLAAQTVTLDGFDVWMDSCPLTNYNNPAQLSATSLNTSGDAGVSNVSLTTPAAWTAASDAPWLHIGPDSQRGTGNALITFAFDANTSGTPRTGTLTIAGLTFIVSQDSQ